MLLDCLTVLNRVQLRECLFIALTQGRDSHLRLISERKRSAEGCGRGAMPFAESTTEIRHIIKAQKRRDICDR
jgi:hypothetical protein